MGEILRTQYHNTPDGHCGNEDCGQMSSWYVLSALGFYPINPADSPYYIGQPLFSQATLHLDNGKTFTIRKGDTNGQLQLNGKPLGRRYLHFKEITDGGELVY